ATLQKKEKNKSETNSPSQTHGIHINPKKKEKIAKAGIPLFLQNFNPVSTAPLPPIQRQPIEGKEEDELLQTDQDNSTIQRQSVDDEKNEETLQEKAIQPKLTIGQPDDEYEHEADRVADQVMRMPKSDTQNNKSTSKSLTHIPVNTIKHPSSGTPLQENIRLQVEPVLQSDLTHVRVHSDSKANQAAQSINAKAFTHQNHIWLGKGQNQSDLELIAHEAAHVTQQQGQGNNHPVDLPFVQRKTAQQVIDEFTNMGGFNLREDALGSELARLAQAGQYGFVMEIINTLNWTNRDDVASEMMSSLSTTDLIRFARNESGVAMLQTMNNVITEWWGFVSGDERDMGRLLRAVIGHEPERELWNWEIIREIKEETSNDLEALAVIFESDLIVDDGTINSRFQVILSATEHLLIPGLQTGIDFGDTGLAPEFQDPHPSSRNQVGHFLTAAGLQFSPGVVSQNIPVFGRIRDMVNAPESMSDEEVALRLTIGHEKAPDPNGRMSALMIVLRGVGEYVLGGSEDETEEEQNERIARAFTEETEQQISLIIGAFRMQFHATTDEDIEAWNNAIESLGTRDILNRSAIEDSLSRIAINPELRGNSREDLRLSLIGWRMGQMISNNEFTSRAEIATWIRNNLGPASSP
ncbi:MAG: DUF4157 domain-containing protein, partial [Bacteroidetes bacterium]|nr:DUF4157 domain-containing protein [Bacteroidota bacterium]